MVALYAFRKAIALWCLSGCSFLGLTANLAAKTATIEVNTTADNRKAGDGSCTLREAIINANVNRDTTNGDCFSGSLPTVDAIAFKLNSSYSSIALNSALPTIREAVIIDGTTLADRERVKTHSLICPNVTGETRSQTITIKPPAIELNGSKAGDVSGITINADGVVVRGLVINRFRRDGIEILNSSSRNLIEGNYLGTDNQGTKALGNSRGIAIAAGKNTNPNNNIIQNNVISGNTFLGVQINGDEGSDRRENYLLNNFIGTDYTGRKLLGNTQGTSGHGVVIGQGGFTKITARYWAENHTIRGNVIAGSYNTNLWLSNYASNNEVACNYIGTDVTGTVALGNCVDGLLIGGTRSNAFSRLNTIRYNLISGNARCRGNTEANLTLQWGAIDNIIENNFIGTDITGKQALSPILSTDGIGIKQPGNLIRNNLIGGHRRHGIHLYRGFGAQPRNNRIENNYIGVHPSGTKIANGGDGVAVFSNINTPNNALLLTNVWISGTQIIGNAIAHNGYNGIRLEARGDEVGFKAAIANTKIVKNVIRDNGTNGIQIAILTIVPKTAAASVNNTIIENRIFANKCSEIEQTRSFPTSHDFFLDGASGDVSTNSPECERKKKKSDRFSFFPG
jgi:CSLREA domain-containing protein